VTAGAHTKQEKEEAVRWRPCGGGGEEVARRSPREVIRRGACLGGPRREVQGRGWVGPTRVQDMGRCGVG
jgi:hypothetical protein